MADKTRNSNSNRGADATTTAPLNTIEGAATATVTATASDNSSNHNPNNSAETQELAQNLLTLSVTTSSTSGGGGEEEQEEASRAVSSSEAQQQQQLHPHQHQQQQTINSNRRADMVTPPVPPELSPSVINKLRERGSSSPATSQVSVGSIPSAQAAVSLLPKYDLTPVMKNTSNEYVDTDQVLGGGGDGTSGTNAATITPGGSGNGGNEGYLHGEHLALPSDLDDLDQHHGGLMGPEMPPLQPSHPFRSSVMNTSSSSSESQFHLSVSSLPLPPVQFPSSKHFSFTSREQYKGATAIGHLHDDDDDDDDLFHASDSEDDDDDDDDVKIGIVRGGGMTPYLPQTRNADFDLESLNDAELAMIFKDSEIPLEQRIPSLRRAYQLVNEGSTTSVSYYTENDEEDSLVRVDDDASLNSQLSLEEIKFLRRQQRKRRKEKQAVEWLSNIPGGEHQIAEAASSKILKAPSPAAAIEPSTMILQVPHTTSSSATRRQSDSITPALLQRQTSSPASMELSLPILTSSRQGFFSAHHQDPYQHQEHHEELPSPIPHQQDHPAEHHHGPQEQQEDEEENKERVCLLPVLERWQQQQQEQGNVESNEEDEGQR